MKNKKMNMLIIIGVFIFGVIFGTYFNHGTEVYAKGNKNYTKLEYVGYCDLDISELRDKKTGVHYFLFEGGYKGAMSVRYNSDGSVYVD